MKNFFTTLFVQRRSSEIQWTLKDILRKFQDLDLHAKQNKRKKLSKYIIKIKNKKPF